MFLAFYPAIFPHFTWIQGEVCGKPTCGPHNPKLGRGCPLGSTSHRRNERDGLERPGPRAIAYIAQIPRLTRRTPKLGWLYLFIFMPQHPTFLVSLFTMAPRMATVLVAWSISAFWVFCNTPHFRPRTGLHSTHAFWECPCIQKFWTLIRNLFSKLDITFPLNSFNDLITFFSLEDIKSLKSTFKNQLIFNGIFSIWAEYTKLMHEFHTFNQMDALELDAYIDDLTPRLVNRYNTQNHHSFLSLPYIHQDIHFRSHIKGNPDLTKSALQARFYQLKPFLNFNPDIITPEIQNAYLTTWCKNSVLYRIFSTT